MTDSENDEPTIMAPFEVHRGAFKSRLEMKRAMKGLSRILLNCDGDDDVYITQGYRVRFHESENRDEYIDYDHRERRFIIHLPKPQKEESIEASRRSALVHYSSNFDELKHRYLTAAWLTLSPEAQRRTLREEEELERKQNSEKKESNGKKKR